MEDDSKKIQIAAAIIVALGTIFAAFITGGFGLVAKYYDTASNFKSNLDSASNSKSILDSAKLNEKNKLIGSRQIITIVPPEIGSLEWKIQCCNQEMIFVSPEENSKWAKFKISGKEHLSQIYVALEDSENGLDNEVLSTGRLKELEPVTLQTKEFTAVITPTEVEVGKDNDPEKQYPSVFIKIVLNIKVDKNTQGSNTNNLNRSANRNIRNSSNNEN